MTRLKSIALLALWVVALAPGIAAQVASLTPRQPQVGQTLILTYNPKAPGAKLTLNEDVYIIGQIYFPERKPVVIKMRKAGEVYQHEFNVPADLGFISFSFRSVNARDPEAKVETLIYRADGLPVRNALLGKLLSEPVRQANNLAQFEQELDLYPDNYAAYAHKWEAMLYAARRTGPSVEFIQAVNKDLELIEQQAKEHNAEYYYAKALSSASMIKLDELLAALKPMLKDYADSPLTWRVLEIFLGRAKLNYDKSDEAKALERKQWELIQRFPDSQIARDSLQAFAWNYDFLNPPGEFPLVALEQIANQWIAAEPDNPFPHTYLARLYHDRQQKTEPAVALAERALALYEVGKHRLYMNSGKIYATENLLADDFLISARLHLRQQKLTEAYVRTLAARMQYQASPFKKTDFKTHELEARILHAQGNLIVAEAAYLTAWMNGSDEAEAGLKEIYQKRQGTVEGFAAYLRGKRDDLANKESVPAFSVTSLNGQKLDLAALKGKLVVLNFWFIACGPCQAEMPGLNTLVTEFKDKGVVFIAFATDQEKELREFLKTKAFNYQIIPSAEALNQKFDIRLWPTHIILNREGKMAQRLSGGGMNRHEELRRLINRLLY
jgi:thiol-disulfide isomerase/thioredoxin